MMAVYASLIANLCLCVLQSRYLFIIRYPVLMCYIPTVYAAISSLSLSLLATGIDSIFDIGSNVLLFYLNKKASRMDVNKWPVGGARLETIGNIVYGMLFCAEAHQSATNVMNISRLPVSIEPCHRFGPDLKMSWWLLAWVLSILWSLSNRFSRS